MLFRVLTLIVLSSMSVGTAAQVGIRFGEIGVLNDYGDHRYTFVFKEEMSRIPLLTMAEGGFYGVEYSAPDFYEYSVQVDSV